MTTSAAEIINEHAQLTSDWRYPNSKLTSYVQAFAEDVLSKRGSYSASNMFYPLFSNPAHDYEHWVQLISKNLFNARVYQITDEMCRAVTAIYRKSTEWLTDQDIPFGEPSERSGRHCLSCGSGISPGELIQRISLTHQKSGQQRFRHFLTTDCQAALNAPARNTTFTGQYIASGGAR